MLMKKFKKEKEAAKRLKEMSTGKVYDEMKRAEKME